MLLSLIIEKHKTDLHLPEENYNTSLVRQLGWITEQTRTDLAFHACQLSSQLNKSTRDSILKANKLLAIAEKKNVLIGIGKHRSIKISRQFVKMRHLQENLKMVDHIDVSLFIQLMKIKFPHQ